MGAFCGKSTFGRGDVEMNITQFMNSVYVNEGIDSMKKKESLSPPILTEEQWEKLLKKGSGAWGEMKIIDYENLAALPSKRSLEEMVKMKFGKGVCEVSFDTILGYPAAEFTNRHPTNCESEEDPKEKSKKKKGKSGAEEKNEEETEKKEDANDSQEDKKSSSNKSKKKTSTSDNSKPELLPVILQSFIPIPPQSDCYFEMEMIKCNPVLGKHSAGIHSYISMGLAKSNFPSKHLPGLLPESVALLSTGALHCENVTPLDNYEMFLDGDVIGCFISRRNCSIVFTINGRPLRVIPFQGVCINEEGVVQNDFFVTIGVMGVGEISLNFGGKPLANTATVKEINKAISSYTPVTNCAFGKKVANFNAYWAQLKLFYSIFDPSKLPKAKQICAMNIIRIEEFEQELRMCHSCDFLQIREIIQEMISRKLHNFLTVQDPVKISKIDAVLDDAKGDIERVNDILNQKYKKDVTTTSLRREESLIDILNEFNSQKDSSKTPEDIQTMARELTREPDVWRERPDLMEPLYEVARLRLGKIYSSMLSGAIERKEEVMDKLLKEYSSPDDIYMLGIKLRWKYGYDMNERNLLDEGFMPKSLKKKKKRNLQLTPDSLLAYLIPKNDPKLFSTSAEVADLALKKTPNNENVEKPTPESIPQNNVDTSDVTAREYVRELVKKSSSNADLERQSQKQEEKVEVVVTDKHSGLSMEEGWYLVADADNFGDKDPEFFGVSSYASMEYIDVVMAVGTAEKVGTPQEKEDHIAPDDTINAVSDDIAELASQKKDHNIINDGAVVSENVDVTAEVDTLPEVEPTFAKDAPTAKDGWKPPHPTPSHFLEPRPLNTRPEGRRSFTQEPEERGEDPESTQSLAPTVEDIGNQHETQLESAAQEQEEEDYEVYMSRQNSYSTAARREYQPSDDEDL